jgi:hypothetical protein
MEYKDGQLLRVKVIKTEADMPKEEGLYFVAEKNYKYIYLCKYELTENFVRVWLRDIDWYLEPIEEQEPSKGAEEIYYQCIDINDNALDRHRHILEAMEQYRSEGLREEHKCKSCGEPLRNYCDRCQHLWET